jgi:hypothetical protein
MDIGFELRGVLKVLTSASRAGSVLMLKYEGFTVKARGDGIMFTLPSKMAVAVKISYVDAAGNPAVVDGDVTWTTSDPSIVTVNVDADDTTNAVIAASGPVGQVQISAVADADLGEGVRQLTTLMDVTVVAGEAVAGTISPVGEPSPVAPTQRV